MKSGMDNMVLKGKWVAVLFYEKNEKNRIVRACNGDANIRLPDCVFL